jgi:hypothetical protein
MIVWMKNKRIMKIPLNLSQFQDPQISKQPQINLESIDNKLPHFSPSAQISLRFSPEKSQITIYSLNYSVKSR